MKYFCNKLKEIFVKSLTEAKEKLNSKNIVKLVERKDRKKIFIQKWRPISLLKVDFSKKSGVVCPQSWYNYKVIWKRHPSR